MNSPPCRIPFEKGTVVCAHCRMQTESSGILRCRRVVAESPAMISTLRKAATIASADASVILCGESGTGKEVLARLLHANSPRAAQPFIAVNVTAIPEHLLESEIFGHARGAFTGATSMRKGLFEAANGGTLFLDEIAEMPLSLQPKLLRVLQDGEVRRVGDSAAFHVDVRLICASHQNLAAAVEAGRFRADLYYRLKVFTLTVPPLRERGEDILPLARHLLERENNAVGLTAAADAALLRWRWPGNVRELVNAMKHGAVLARGEAVGVEDLPEDVQGGLRDEGEDLPMRLGTLAQVEREHILRVLRATGGHHVEASRVLGIGRTTLWRKLREYGIDDG